MQGGGVATHPPFFIPYMEKSTVTGLILAGGKSRRLGQDKRFLELGGRTCLQRVLDVFSEIFTDVLVVADAAEPFKEMGVKVVVDLIPGRATLGGLYTGLHYAADRVFAAACDMPGLSPSAIRVVLAHAGDGDIVVPDLEGRLQPMHAVYSKACLPVIKSLVEAQSLKIQDLFARQELRVYRIPKEAFQAVDPDLRSFFNINTPDDLARARKWIGT